MAEKKGVDSQKFPAKNRLVGLLPILISLFWILVIVPDYLFHHPYYSQGISQFKYWGLLVALGLIFGAGYFLLFKTRQKHPKLKIKTLNGLKIYLFLLIIMNIILAWYGISNGLFQTNLAARLLYFTGFVILLHAAVLFILLLGYAAGSLFMQAFSEWFAKSSNQLVSIALGLSLIGFVLAILGFFNSLLVAWILWPLAMVLLIFRYRLLTPFLKALLLSPVSVKKLKVQGFLGASLLIVFAAVNLIGAIKAFPIGFDGTAVYMNITKLISEYHGLPEGGQAYYWSVIMSLGHLLFGSTTVSILLSHLAGILCLMVVYRIACLFLTRSNAILAAAIFYTAPFITFHNYFDEKIDLGFLFISLSTVLLLLEFFRNKEKVINSTNKPHLLKIGTLNLKPDLLIWIYAGWLTGFAFGIKYTALFSAIALITMLFYKKGGRNAFLGSLLVSFSLIFLLGIYRFAGIELNGISPLLLIGLLTIPGVTLLGFAFRESQSKILNTVVIAFAFALAASVAFAPWGLKHLMENKSVSVSSIIQGKSPTPLIPIKAEYQKLSANKTLKAEQSEGELSAFDKTRREELQRYMGFERGLPLYFSLPYDLTMNTNLPGLIYQDIGFLFLLILPLTFLTAGPKETGQNLLVFLLMLFMLFTSMLSAYIFKTDPTLPETLLSQQSTTFATAFGGFYMTAMDLLIYLANKIRGIYEWLSGFNFIACLVAILIIMASALWLATEKLKMLSLTLKMLLAFIVTYLCLWMLLGNGISWYAFPMLAVLPILLVYYFEHPKQFLGAVNARFSRTFLSISFGFYLFLNLCLHFSDPDRGNNRHLIFKNPFIQYAVGNMDKHEVLAGFNPFFQEALQHLNNNPSEKVYRVGTYMQYHITQNDRRVVEDNQLGKFDEISKDLSDPDYFFSLLNEGGFRYILYDLNTASIDKTPEQSLVKKNNAFVNLLLNSERIQLLITDRIIQDPGGGEVRLPNGTIPGNPGLVGQQVYPGTFALFKIL